MASERERKRERETEISDSLLAVSGEILEGCNGLILEKVMKTHQSDSGLRKIAEKVIDGELLRPLYTPC